MVACISCNKFRSQIYRDCRRNASFAKDRRLSCSLEILGATQSAGDLNAINALFNYLK